LRYFLEEFSTVNMLANACKNLARSRPFRAHLARFDFHCFQMTFTPNSIQYRNVSGAVKEVDIDTQFLWRIAGREHVDELLDVFAKDFMVDEPICKVCTELNGKQLQRRPFISSSETGLGIGQGRQNRLSRNG